MTEQQAAGTTTPAIKVAVYFGDGGTLTSLDVEIAAEGVSMEDVNTLVDRLVGLNRAQPAAQSQEQAPEQWPLPAEGEEQPVPSSPPEGQVRMMYAAEGDTSRTFPVAGSHPPQQTR